ncbi:MAG: ABC transporter permease [Firmicutes bacterium]|nr:ABC transporter permease [Bacillota bacterium]
MRSSFYRKLAFTNIKRNAQTYIPYILSCILTVMMFYSIFAMAENDSLSRMSGGGDIKILLRMGTVIVGLFALIFLYYTNSFLIKRRKKEFGLFNILGMEKRHIAKTMVWETFYISFGSIALGIVAGTLVSKLVFLVLLKILSFPVPLGFQISGKAIVASLVLFGGIFILTLFYNLCQVHVAKPIELLKGNQLGEREPRTKWLLMLLGFVSLGAGYTLALRVEAPLAALKYFFTAVILVIIGTHCVFTAGSIGILKMLRHNKTFYYRPNKFIAVSGMIYRMKQNAVGLANICILSSMVLVTLSTTISLYIGVEDVLVDRYPQELVITSRGKSEEEMAELRSQVDKVLAKHNLTIQESVEYRYYALPGLFEGDTFITGNEYQPTNTPNIHLLAISPLEDVVRSQEEHHTLAENEIFLLGSRGTYTSDTLTVFGQTFRVKGQIESSVIYGDGLNLMVPATHIVVRDFAVVERLQQAEVALSGDSLSQITHYYGFNAAMNSQVGQAVYGDLRVALPGSTVESRDASRMDFYTLYGGLFFLGIFLGTLFVMATVLIIYYKQITEGFEDKERYVIMQQVGMSREEVKGAVRSQVLMVFFLPLVTAGVHVAFAFKMIFKLLAIFNLHNITLYALCTLGTFAAFGLLYALVYAITAKVYYRIVEY